MSNSVKRLQALSALRVYPRGRRLKSCPATKFRFGSLLGNCAPSRSPAEGHPQVLIIARQGAGRALMLANLGKTIDHPDALVINLHLAVDDCPRKLRAARIDRTRMTQSAPFCRINRIGLDSSKFPARSTSMSAACRQLGWWDSKFAGREVSDPGGAGLLLEV